MLLNSTPFFSDTKNQAHSIHYNYLINRELMWAHRLLGRLSKIKDTVKSRHFTAEIATRPVKKHCNCKIVLPFHKWDDEGTRM
jgi:hypothetical protein